MRVLLCVVCLIMVCVSPVAEAETEDAVLGIYSVEFQPSIPLHQLDQVCTVLFPEGYEGDGDVVVNASPDSIISFMLHRYGWTSAGIGDLSLTGYADGTCVVDFKVRHEQGEIQLDVNDKVFPLGDDLPVGCSMSMSQAIQRTSEVVHILAPELSFFSAGKMQGEVIGNAAHTVRSDTEAYFIVFTSSRLPTKALNISSVSFFSYPSARKRECFRLTVTDLGIDAFEFSYPVQSLRKISDTPIIGREEASQIAFRSLKEKAVAQSTLYEDMVLGYYLYLDAKFGYCYVPIWCYYDHDAYTPDTALCLVRADTGEVIPLT